MKLHGLSYRIFQSGISCQLVVGSRAVFSFNVMYFLLPRPLGVYADSNGGCESVFGLLKYYIYIYFLFSPQLIRLDKLTTLSSFFDFCLEAYRLIVISQLFHADQKLCLKIMLVTNEYKWANILL